MEALKEINKKIDLAEKAQVKLTDAYLLFLEHTPNLKPEEFDSTLSRLQSINQDNLVSKAWFSLSKGLQYSFRPELGNGIEILMEACDLFIQINDILGLGISQTFLALHYKNLGQLDKSQEIVHQAIINIIACNLPTYFLGVAYFQAGDIHQILKNFDAAETMFSKGLSFFENDHPIYPRLLNGMGCVYKEKNEPEKALSCFKQSLDSLKGKNNYILESKNLADIGNYYFRLNDFENAIKYQNQSITIRKERKLNNPLVTNLLELAEVYLKKENLNEALEYAKEAEKITNEANIVVKKYLVDLTLSHIYEKMNNNELALFHYKKYHTSQVELLNNENAKKFKEATAIHEYETLQKEKEISQLRNVELKEALDEIGASVRYAKRIQSAILPPIDLIQQKIPHSFIYYQPKDIVAGDFYFMEIVDDWTFIAAADCTGHGVPGALVSVICSNALNRAIHEHRLKLPGEILDKTTNIVCETFAKSLEEVKDGMDISLLAINNNRKEILWSGANNPLWIIKAGELVEVPPNKQPVGKSDNRIPFTTHNLNYCKESNFFLFTDGYADQFGGPSGKKYKYKKFKEFLLKIIHKTPNEQLVSLNFEFENWRGKLEQVDDICIIGIKLS